MLIFSIIFTIVCCYITYRITAYGIEKVNDNNSNAFEDVYKHLNKLVDDTNQIKKDIYKLK